MNGDDIRVESLIIEAVGDKICARSGSTTITAPTLTALWSRIANAPGPGFVHLTVAGMAPDSASLEALLQEMISAGCEVSLARVRYADGVLSRAVHKAETTRYLNAAAGAILVQREALRGVAARLPARAFDDFWMFDLVNVLTRFKRIFASARTIAASRALDGARQFERMPFARACPIPHEETAPLILVYGPIEASTSLYFDGLPEDLRGRLRHLRPGDLASDLGWLASASLVLVTRGFEHFLASGAADLLDEIGVPYLWFVDDDFIALSGEAPLLEFYTRERVAAFVSRCAGLVVTSAPLALALQDKLGTAIRRTILWPCVYDDDLAAPAPSALGPVLKLGAFGGAFRRASLLRDILPDIADLQEQGALELCLTRALAPADLPRGTHVLPFQGEFRSFVLDWQRLGLNVVVHPYGASANLANKSAASLLVASYLGANAIIGDEPAYAGLGEAEGVLRADRMPGAWRASVERLRDPAEAAAMSARLDAWRRRAFDPELARAPFSKLEELAAPGGESARDLRWQRACASTTLRQMFQRPKTGGLRKLQRSFRKKWARLREWLRRR